MRKTFLNWSAGKDAAFALYHLQNNDQYEVDRLFTTINRSSHRVSMQGVRQELLEVQIKETGLASTIVELPDQPDMDVYNKIMGAELSRLKSEGYGTAAFGDIFLEDLRSFREKQMAELGFEAVFPLWEKNTNRLINQFIELGFKAVVSLIRDDALDRSFLGRELSKQFVEDLPDSVDPCGEHGEYHTFCYDGPVFKRPIEIQKGKQFYKEYKAPSGSNGEKVKYWFQDLFF